MTGKVEPNGICCVCMLVPVPAMSAAAAVFDNEIKLASCDTIPFPNSTAELAAVIVLFRCRSPECFVSDIRVFTPSEIVSRLAAASFVILIFPSPSSTEENEESTTTVEFVAADSLNSAAALFESTCIVSPTSRSPATTVPSVAFDNWNTVTPPVLMEPSCVRSNVVPEELKLRVASAAFEALISSIALPAPLACSQTLAESALEITDI